MTSDKPLQIHFLTSFVHEQGTYFRFHNLAVGLTKLGQKVTIYACDLDPKTQARTENRDGITYHIVPTSRGHFLFGYGCNPITTLRRALSPYPECDICHLFQPFPTSALPWQCHRNAKARFYDWDDLWSGGLMGKAMTLRTAWETTLTHWYENALPRQADMVTTCSHFLADLASQRHAKHTQVIHNGFWPSKMSDKKAARGILGLDHEALYAGFMGRTTNELAWCFEAMARNLHQYPNLRFALCGAAPSSLDGLSEEVLQRTDYLGQLTPLQTRDFAAALDLGLLPLENNAFNRSRFPIKYAEYMAAGTPILCSGVGECSHLSTHFPWVIEAGTTKEEWLASFQRTMPLLLSGKVATVDEEVVADKFSWLNISCQLLESYRNALNG